MNCALAIDQSTSATKAMLIDVREGRILDKCAQQHRQLHPRPGWVEHDAEEIWRNVLSTVAKLLARRTDSSSQISAISIANQRETVVIFDRRTGKALRPAIVWQCRRGDELCTRQIALGREEKITQLTGLRVDGYFSASKLQWLVRNDRDLAERLEDGSALIGTIDCFLIFRLTAGRVFATDHTNASRTLLYDIDKLAWDSGLCDWWEVPMRALPEIRSCDAHYGTSDVEGLLPTAVPIRGVIGDSQASLFAHRCFEPGSAKVTFGTGSSVLLNKGATRPATIPGTVVGVAWVIAGEPTYALEGLIHCSAASLVWLRDQLGLFVNVTECESLAAEVDQPTGVYLVPAFSGLGAPYWRDTARAAIVGLSAQSDRRHIIRAALESMAYQLRDVLSMMKQGGAVELARIHCDGEPTTNKLLMQFTADIIGVQMHVARTADGSALGAALIGAIGMGLHESTAALACLPTDGTVYDARMPHDQAESRYAGWQRAIQQVLCVA
jgi:glycerol kinase